MKCEVCGGAAEKGKPIRRARRIRVGECVSHPSLHATLVRAHFVCAVSEGMYVHGSKQKNELRSKKGNDSAN